MTVVAFLGTTISPYLFFWQAGETVEEGVAEGSADEPGRRKKRVREGEIHNLRADTVMGMAASQGVAFFILVATAGTLFAAHKTNINTAQDAARALGPLGPAAVWIFTIGIIGSGALAVPTLAGSAAYAASESFGWRYGLYRRFSRAPGFYLTFLGVMATGYAMNFFTSLSPVKALVYSAVANGVAAVPLIFMLMLMCNNSRILKKRTNRIWSNLFGWIAFVSMGAASAYFIYGVVTGKAG
jgi:Mn2+/Fe2+ NRAMP family transporter